MIVFVKKHPNPYTIADVRESSHGQQAPEGYEEMSYESYFSWRDAEIAGGWQPAQFPEEDPQSLHCPQELPTWRVRAICKLTPYGQTNLGHAIEALIASLEDPIKTIADQVWNRGNTISRSSSIVSQIASSLGLNDSQIDELFIQAAQLPT